MGIHRQRLGRRQSATPIGYRPCAHGEGRHTALVLSLLLVAGLASFMAAAPAAAEGISVGAAASLRDPLIEIQRAYQSRADGSDLLVSYGPSHMLGRQIRFGAPIDVFLSADERILDELAAEGRIVAGSRFAWLSNRLVILRARDSDLRVTAPVDLARRQVKRIAIASEAAPLGRYSREWLRLHRLEAPLADRLVVTEHALAALGAVELGHAELAIVYTSDAMAAKRSTIAYEIPDAEQPRIRYGAARIAPEVEEPGFGSGHRSQPAPERDPVRDFLAFLRGPQAREILTRHGFQVLTPSP